MVCGTGTGNFPQPGDPDLNGATLSARAVLTGIEVSWSFPLINPHALAYVNVFRNTANNFATAQLRTQWSSSLFLDTEFPEQETTFYYWIQMVSINGTIGNVIGPASATLKATVDSIIEILTNQIAESHLAGALREKVNSVVGFESGLRAEIEALIYDDGLLQQLLNELRQDLDAVDTLVYNEVIQRVEGDSALVAAINVIQAQSNGNEAAIIQEQVARTTADSSLAASITTLNAKVNTNTAAISQEASTRASADSATATTLSNLQTAVNNNAAAIVAEQTARSTADSAIASSVTTLTTTVNGHTSSISQAMTSLNGLSAEYSVRLDVDGYVSGFGQYNNGTSADFLIHADRFAIGKPGLSKDYPFIIGTVNGATKIALNAATFIPDLSVTAAKIENLSVDSLKIANNAVTVPYSSTGGMSAISGSGWTDLLIIPAWWGSSIPLVVLGLASMVFGNNSGVAQTCRLRIVTSSGGVSNEWAITVDNGKSAALSGAAHSTPGGASVTYYLQGKTDSGVVSVHNSSLIIMGSRK